jgi:hypothetical protein
VLPEDLRPATFVEEESADLRRQLVRHSIRLTLVFALLFFFVFMAFTWSGAAVRFGASRVGDRGAPSWSVTGTVRNAITHQRVPWAAIDDDRTGQGPYFHADADQSGGFELHTLAEPHRMVVSAPGYKPYAVRVGRVWFLWIPRGQERRDVELTPE